MSQIPLAQLCEPAIAIVHQAAEHLLSLFGRLREQDILSKSSQADLVSVADRETEALLRDKLCGLLPGSGFVGEEFDDLAAGDSGYSWVVDPLDGTSNYVSGLPIWCTSVGLCDADLNPVLGIVNAPLLNRCWTAMEGTGALVNGTPCRVRTSPPGGGLQNSMLATGFPYDVGTSIDNNLEYFLKMQSRFQKIRRMGSAAIDLAYLAEGVFDGMWELKLKPWDCAAGMLIVKEAGGCFSRIDGSEYRLGDMDMVAAATPQLLGTMRATMTGTDR